MQIDNLKLGAGEEEGTAQQEPHKQEESERQRNNTPGFKKDAAKKKESSKRWSSLHEIYGLHVVVPKKDIANTLTFGGLYRIFQSKQYMTCRERERVEKEIKLHVNVQCFVHLH